MRPIGNMKCLLLGALCLSGVTLSFAQNLKEFEKRVTEFSLSNGMHFIVLERHEAPVVSFHAYVNVGSVDDPAGHTSMAHMFEHMIGKGTTTVGTTNYPEEKKALDAVETAYDRLEQEQNKEAKADPARLKQLQEALDAAVEKANSYVDPNAYVRTIEENGAAGFNASTGSDATTYYYSLPANRAELWFLLQSDWFRRPVFREFYKERDVVREERRMRVESSPVGKLQEVLMGTAFQAHPYRVMIGWASDIENLRASGAEAFFQKYYGPGNITIAVAGDVNPAEMRRLADKYFAAIPARPLPAPVRTVEPPQEGERRITIETGIQPYVIMAFKRPDQQHKDDPVFDVIASILSTGRTGLLYTTLVRDRKLALGAGADATTPSGKYSNLFLVVSVPAPGKTVEENERACYEVLDRLKKEPVDAETLTRVKTKLRAGLIRQLDSNAGLASQLASYYVNYGDWRKLFTGLDEIERVTAADVQRVAREYFQQATRTVAYTVPPSKAEGNKADGSKGETQ